MIVSTSYMKVNIILTEVVSLSFKQLLVGLFSAMRDYLVLHVHRLKHIMVCSNQLKSVGFGNMFLGGLQF